MVDDLRELLSGYAQAALKDMARHAGPDIASKSTSFKRAALIELLLNESFTAERIRASYQALSEHDRQIVQRLVAIGGKAPTRWLKRRLIAANVAREASGSEINASRESVAYASGYMGAPWRTDSDIFEDIMARLTLNRMVFSEIRSTDSSSRQYRLHFQPATMLVVPRRVQKHLPKQAAASAEQRDWTAEPVDGRHREIWLRDLYIYWEQCRRAPIPLLKTGFVSKRALRSIKQLLLEPERHMAEVQREDDSRRLMLLRAMLVRLGLIRQDYLGTALCTVLDKATAIPAFWRESRREQTRRCLSVLPNVLGDFPYLAAKDNTIIEFARPGSALRTLYAQIAQLPSGQWVTPSEMLDRLQVHDQCFLYADRLGYERVAMEWGRHSSAGDNLERMDQSEERFVQFCLQEFLYPFGVIEIARENGRLAAFRPSSDAASLLASKPPKSTTPPRDSSARVVVQPNFEIMVLGPVSFSLLARLDLFCDRKAADQGVFTYHLTRQSAYRGQQLGVPASQIAEWLERASQTPLPQNIARSLQEWGAQHSRITLHQGVDLLQAANAHDLQALLAEPALGKLIDRPLTEALALVKAGQREALVSNLLDREHLPVVSDADAASTDSSIVVDANGHLAPIHATPSLFLAQRLAQLAEKTAAGEWSITERSIGQIGGSREKVLAVLDDLTHLCDGPLPEELVERIKSWGSLYGQATMQTVTLIEFASPESMQEIINRAGLADLVTSLQDDKSALAIVAPEQAEFVQARLREYGLAVSEKIADDTEARRRT